MMRDDKLVRVAIRSGQTIERVVWIYGAILESAAEIDDNGRYDISADEIAYFLRADLADVEAVLVGLRELGRIDDAAVVKWDARQFNSDRSADRQARYRERKKAEKLRDNPETSGDADVTSPSRHRDAPETETETEEEKLEAIASSKKTDPRGTRLPSDWEPNPFTGKTAEMVAAWPCGMLERELSKFRDHFAKTPGARGRSLDWNASFRNWLRNADERKPSNGRSNTLGGHKPADGLSSTARAALQVFGR
jgi:hypothetical protein